jgi:hypothetical protein
MILNYVNNIIIISLLIQHISRLQILPTPSTSHQCRLWSINHTIIFFFHSSISPKYIKPKEILWSIRYHKSKLHNSDDRRNIVIQSTLRRKMKLFSIYNPPGFGLYCHNPTYFTKQLLQLYSIFRTYGIKMKSFL